MSPTFPIWRAALAAAATFYVSKNFVEPTTALSAAGIVAMYVYQWQRVRLPRVGRIARYPGSTLAQPGGVDAYSAN